MQFRKLQGRTVPRFRMLIEDQVVKLKIGGEKSGVLDAFVKITPNGVLEAHLDTDDANAFLISNGDKGTLII